MQSPAKDTVTTRSSGAKVGEGVGVLVGVDDGVGSVETVSRTTVVAADCATSVSKVPRVSSVSPVPALLQAAMFADIAVTRTVVRSSFRVWLKRVFFTGGATFQKIRNADFEVGI